MIEATIIEFTIEALILVLILSLPSIMVASIVGTLVSLIQALTQVQEQTLSFTVKLIMIAATLYFTSSWMGGEMLRYTTNILAMLPILSGS